MTSRYRRDPARAKAIPRRTALGRLAALPILPSLLAAAAPDPAPPRLPRDQPLLYRTRSGAIRAARSPAEWQSRLREIRAAFDAIAGPDPRPHPGAPPSFTIEEETDCGEYVRRRITFTADPGGGVPAWLLVPRKALEGHRCPAALCLHQTHAAGSRTVVGLADSPDDEYGVELARRGTVCLAPPYPLLADYHPDLAGLGYASGVRLATWNNRRGIDLLQSFPFVRPGPVAAIGHSLGGHTALFTAFLDPRIGVVVTSCAFDAFVDYMNGDLTGWTQTRYFPRLRAYLGRPGQVPFDFHELIAALAPRALYASAPLHDSNFRWESVGRVAAAARPVYALYHAAHRLRVRHPDAPHRFPPEIRREAYDFIDENLGA